MAPSKLTISKNRFIVLLLTGLVLVTVALLAGYSHFSGERGLPVKSVLEKLHGELTSSKTHSDTQEKVQVDLPSKVNAEPPPAETHEVAPSETPSKTTTTTPPPTKGRPRVVARVFYGRRDRVSILDCYLQVRCVLVPMPIPRVRLLC